ncbi:MULTISPECIES: DUF4390 domain-containing protein [Candidatus Ichthyocystis]|uniref:DUF4390 domain-containing protein n=1 Tax=Candidatus Ichthyocystis TaxID=2929841 RepID=UPI00158588F2|nr:MULTISPECIES: DUF4390 domain-containing protein [Ichthyocystis]
MLLLPKSSKARNLSVVLIKLMAPLLFFLPGSCLGQILITHGSLSYKGGCLSVQYAFKVSFPDDLNNLVRLGVAVYLGSEFRLEKKRSFWFDEQLVDETQEWKISYHAITGKYYLTRNGSYLPFNSLDELLSQLNHIYSWQLTCSIRMLDSSQYQAMMRVFIVTDKLPSVFQIGSGGYIRWQSDSGWLRWDFMLNEGAFSVDAL